MQTWDLNPVTGDYINVGGRPQETNHLTVPAYVRLKAPRQGLKKKDGEPSGWMYAPDAKWGSTFFDKAGTRVSSRGITEMEQIAAVALQPLLDDGRAMRITEQVLVTSRGAFGFQASIEEVNDQSQVIIPSLGI